MTPAANGRRERGSGVAALGGDSPSGSMLRRAAPTPQLAASLELAPEALELVAELVAGKLADRVGVSPWLNVEQAAEYLACPRSRIHDLVGARRLRVARDGRRLLFRRAWLDAILELSEGAK